MKTGKLFITIIIYKECVMTATFCSFIYCKKKQLVTISVKGKQDFSYF